MSRRSEPDNDFAMFATSFENLMRTPPVDTGEPWQRIDNGRLDIGVLRVVSAPWWRRLGYRLGNRYAPAVAAATAVAVWEWLARNVVPRRRP